MSLFKVTETKHAVIEAPTAAEAERLYREYPLLPERQEAVRRIGETTIAAEEVAS